MCQRGGLEKKNNFEILSRVLTKWGSFIDASTSTCDLKNI